VRFGSAASTSALMDEPAIGRLSEEARAFLAKDAALLELNPISLWFKSPGEYPNAGSFPVWCLSIPPEKASSSAPNWSVEHRCCRSAQGTHVGRKMYSGNSSDILLKANFGDIMFSSVSQPEKPRGGFPVPCVVTLQYFKHIF
jgi:hypothetical protein